MLEKRAVLWAGLIAIALAGCSLEADEVTPPEAIQVVRLTFNDSWSDYEPVWSPEGGKILFKSSRVQESENASERDLFIMNPDGSGQRRLTDTTEGIERVWSEGAWSLDGAQIAVGIRHGYGIGANPFKIYTFPLIENGHEPVAFEDMALLVDFGYSFPALDPAWSPDGEKLAFCYGSFQVLSQGGGSNIALLDLESGEVTKITDENQMYAYDLSWSPDNETIAFAGEVVSGEERNTFIFLVEIHSGKVSQLTYLGEESEPAWSPDGRWIVFTGEENFLNGLYLVNVQSGKPYKLIESKEISEILCCSSWSPDGQWIAFSTPMGNEYMDIYLMDMSWLEMEW